MDTRGDAPDFVDGNTCNGEKVSARDERWLANGPWVQTLVDNSISKEGEGLVAQRGRGEGEGLLARVYDSHDEACQSGATGSEGMFLFLPF